MQRRASAAIGSSGLWSRWHAWPSSCSRRPPQVRSRSAVAIDGRRADTINPWLCPPSVVVPTVQPTPVLVAQPTAVPTFPPAPTSTPMPTAGDAWQATLTRLDAVWQTDWPASIAILDSYLQQYPDQQPAIDKLYAALVEYGGALIESRKHERRHCPPRAGAGTCTRSSGGPERFGRTYPDSASSRNSRSRAAANIYARARVTRLRRDRNSRVGACEPLTVGNSRLESRRPRLEQEQLKTVVECSSAPTATPVKPATSAPTIVPMHVTGGDTVVPTATSVRTRIPTLVATPTRTISNATPTVRALP